MTLLILAANALGFPALQLAVAWIFMRLPDRWFSDSGMSAISAAEERFYRGVLRIRSWKGTLPDGGSWVGSPFDYGRALQSREGRRQFVRETRRSEASHWTALLASAVFLAWNPPWASCVMVAAGILFNAPCIAVQRYNRAVLQRAARSARSRPAADGLPPV